MPTLAQIVDFWKRYGLSDYDYEKMRSLIQKHLEYGTIAWVEKDGEMAAFSRWNVDGNKAFIIDAVVRPDFKNRRLLKLMVMKGLRICPQVTEMEYDRGFKDERRRCFDCMRFLGVKNAEKV